jgi:hypothetical protein
MNSSDLLTSLTTHDPAPLTALTEHEAQRKNTLLNTITATEREAVVISAPLRMIRRRALFGGGILAVGAAAAVIALLASHVGGPATVKPSTDALSSISLASWTSTPATLAISSPAGKAAQSWCLDSIAGNGGSGPSTVTNADSRGSVTSLIVTRGGYSFLCLVGADSLGMWETVADPSTPSTIPALDAVTIDSQGNRGESANGFSYAEGLAGPSVSGVTLVENGTVVTATVQAGRWTAWWPSTDAGTLGGDLTISTADGSVHTTPAATLER